MKYSVNDFNRAFADEAVSVVDQNRLHMQIAYDVVDMVNQIVAFNDSKSAVTTVPLRDSRDAAFVVAQVAARLRVLLAEGAFVPKSEVTRLTKEIEALESEIARLESELSYATEGEV